MQDFLNTAPPGRGRGDDLLATEASAQAWIDDALVDRPRSEVPRITSRDLLELRRLREALRRLVTSAGSSAAPASKWDIEVSATLDQAGHVQLLPIGANWKYVGSLLLIETRIAQEQGVWERLKTCRNDSCTWAFYDDSPANQQRFHSAAGCGDAQGDAPALSSTTA
ncbi:MAG: CGNR zinc finger domain-containing protein [Thermoleophilia bacterium]|nr:CGNR zinc finger domain-containing protein [Thermoleophilia bacterium]